MKVTVPSLALAGLLLCSSVWAIDNPDSSDPLESFRTKARPFAAQIQSPANSTQDYHRIYGDYLQFLDKELNQAYQSLMTRLGDTEKRQLRLAQRQWLKYRDAEFQFVDRNWTAAQFGSSSGLSRGAYKTSLVRARVEALLGYLQNY